MFADKNDYRTYKIDEIKINDNSEADVARLTTAAENRSLNDVNICNENVTQNIPDVKTEIKLKQKKTEPTFVGVSADNSVKATTISSINDNVTQNIPDVKRERVAVSGSLSHSQHTHRTQHHYRPTSPILALPELCSLFSPPPHL